jgi:hypothetical protein
MADYSSIRVRPAVADQARALGRRLAALADRDVTLSDTLAAALTYAAGHASEVAAILTENRELANLQNPKPSTV